MAPAVTSDGNTPTGFLNLGSWALTSLVTFVFYVGLCSALRYQRINRLRARYGFPDRASLARMSNQDAQEIMTITSTYEFPTFFDLSLRLAVFKTYAMDNIGKLLYNVSDLAKPDQAPKRYDDTQILYASFAKFPPGSELLAKSIARTNYLHSSYIKSGRILNIDLLYVLYASLAEPIRFMRLYEWRPLSDVEVAALGTYWKYIGDMMEIDYVAELKKDQWKDGIEFIDDLSKWAHEYEIEHMKPSPEVGELGAMLVDLLLSAYPKFMRPLGYKIIMVLMGERMRHTFSFPEPGIPESVLAFSLLYIRQLCMRYLALPRIKPFSFVSDPDPITGRIHQHNFLKEPWYTKATNWSRWGPEALFRRTFGLMNPGDGGARMKPEGFLFEDLGPLSKVGKGVEETARMAEIARGKVSASTCPFSLGVKS